jgi:hypothetical protein
MLSMDEEKRRGVNVSNLLTPYKIVDFPHLYARNPHNFKLPSRSCEHAEKAGIYNLYLNGKPNLNKN